MTAARRRLDAAAEPYEHVMPLLVAMLRPLSDQRDDPRALATLVAIRDEAARRAAEMSERLHLPVVGVTALEVQRLSCEERWSPPISFTLPESCGSIFLKDLITGTFGEVENLSVLINHPDMSQATISWSGGPTVGEVEALCDPFRSRACEFIYTRVV